jgi:hypothetical protein
VEDAEQQQLRTNVGRTALSSILIR